MAEKHGNRWRVKIRKKDGTRGYETFGTEREALAYEAAPRRFQYRSAIDPKGRARIAQQEARAGMELATYCQSVLDRKDLRQSSKDLYAKGLVYIQAAPIGQVRVGRVRAADVVEFWSGLKVQRMAVHQLLTMAFTQALREGIITVSPLFRAGITRPRTAKGERVQRPLTSSEIEKLASVVSERDALIIRLGGFAGLRAGEIGGLRVQDVDTPRCRLTIAQSATKTSAGRALGLPKKRASLRTIQIDTELAAELGAFIERNPHRDGLVFRTSQGGLITANHVDRFFTIARRKAGLEGFTFHDLRHARASALAAAGMPMPTLQGYMGWASIAMTDVYVHLAPDSDVGDVVERIRH